MSKSGYNWSVAWQTKLKQGSLRIFWHSLACFSVQLVYISARFHSCIGCRCALRHLELGPFWSGAERFKIFISLDFSKIAFKLGGAPLQAVWLKVKESS